VVFPEGDNDKILRACHSILEEKIATPILLGNAASIQAKTAELGLDLNRRTDRRSRRHRRCAKLHPGTVPPASAPGCDR
jgi:phosphotransacetylase